MTQPFHVLLAEDSAPARIEITRFLTSELRATVQPHERVTSAWTACSSRLFDGAVLDVNLPDGSGVELATRLARYSPKARVVLCTVEPESVRAVARERGWHLADKRRLVVDLRLAFAHEMPTEPQGRRITPSG